MKLSKIFTRLNKANLTKRFLTRLVTVHGCWAETFLDCQITSLEITGKITRKQAKKYKQWLNEIQLEEWKKMGIE